MSTILNPSKKATNITPDNTPLITVQIAGVRTCCIALFSADIPTPAIQAKARHAKQCNAHLLSGSTMRVIIVKLITVPTVWNSAKARK